MNKNKVHRTALLGLAIVWVCLEIAGTTIVLFQHSRKIPDELEKFVAEKNPRELQAKTDSWPAGLKPSRLEGR